MPTPDADRIEWPAGQTAARVLGAATAERGALGNGVLRALGTLYGSGVWLRNAAFDLGLRKSHKAAIPVISIGNVVAGGAGKTPFTRWLVDLLTTRQRTVAIVHGGYASDEPALHRQWQPNVKVIEERDRVRAVAEAAAAGAEIAVLDDAFQHRRLARDVDIVLAPVEAPSRDLLPRGPMREPMRNLTRADIIVVTRKTASLDRARSFAREIGTETGRPCAVAALQASGLRSLRDPQAPKPHEAVLVTGIARPDLLLDQLRGFGLNVLTTLAYPDHYDYGEKDIGRIQEASTGRAIVTTEKDAVKLASLIPTADLWVVEQKVVIEDGLDTLLAVLQRVL